MVSARLLLFQDKEVEQRQWEKVKWSWSQAGEWYTVKSKVRGIETKRMFRIEDDGRDAVTQIKDQAQRAVQDVIDRFEIMYKAKLGLLDDPEGGVEIKW